MLTLVTATSSAADPAGDREAAVYRPSLATPELLKPFEADIRPGHDAFPEEAAAVDLEARLRTLGDRLKAHPDTGGSVAEWLLAHDFRGARLTSSPAAPPAGAGPTLSVQRATDLPAVLSLDGRSFQSELRTLTAGLRQVATAEFIVTAIEGTPQCTPGAQPACTGLLHTTVRYDIVGQGDAAWRQEHVGEWKMTWRRDGPEWRVTEWSAASDVASRAATPVFTEATAAVLGGDEAFRRQLTTPLDAWMATLDSVLTRDSNGHHGVSAGDFDGDGLDDLYVAQPAGLPNRLFHHRADGTFEDVTAQAGVGVLDDTAMSLFVDVDNDGDEDLVIAASTRPLLFVNAGGGRFTPVADAFTFDRPLQGSITSISMADYDRDGFLDLYVCVYSYFYGAGEDKAGTPAPYYDARNGPPGILFHNDGHGRFTEATRQAGLDEGNDRYHFAAAWGDYDADGWPDLLVANDFGTKNLYRNRGDGTFVDMAQKAGVQDYGAGMSATFLDYDNDGRLDIYTGNMWAASGLRVTAAPAFMPDIPPDVRAAYQRHARGNALFRNLGDGRFEDVTMAAHANMGRWAWSSDTLDFDSDGWDDLYVVNGMLSRGGDDLESFFWRQVVARSPLTRAKGTPYDDAWRAINQLLIRGSIASRQRNVFLRNDGHGGFDDVSGSVGLDLDQDGRSFAVLDIDLDGDPDLVVMAARQAPQLRVFRNDYAPRGASLAVRLTGAKSNRDAVGARVIVETDRMRKTKVVQAGSGFLSEHSKELLFGLGPSQQVKQLTVEWPSGARQVFTNVRPNTRVRLTEGGQIQAEAFAAGDGGAEAPPHVQQKADGGAEAPPHVQQKTQGAREDAGPSDATWLYEPFPAPEFTAQDLGGAMQSLSSLRGHPSLLLFWTSNVPAAREAVQALARGRGVLTRAGIGSIAIALDPPEQIAAVRAAAPPGVPVVAAGRELALSYALLNRHVFMNRQDLVLPTAFLIDADGRVVRAYRRRIDVTAVVTDAASIDVTPDVRLARALPFPGTLYSPVPRRNYLPYGRELLDEGLDAAAVVAFERAADASPTAYTLYRLGTLLLKTGEAGRARAAFERALAAQPDLAEANNDLGTLLAQDGQLEAAIARFRLALASTPEYPDALNNLGYALLLSGQNDEARALYEKALALQPDFPEALNNLGLLYGRAGDLDRAEQYFRRALERRPDYGEAADNVAVVLVNRGQARAATALLEGFIERSPRFQPAYITLARIYFGTSQPAAGLRVLDRLLQWSPSDAEALALVRQWKSH